MLTAGWANGFITLLKSLNIDSTRLKGSRGERFPNRMYVEANVEVVCPVLNISQRGRGEVTTQGYISVIQGTIITSSLDSFKFQFWKWTVYTTVTQNNKNSDTKQQPLNVTQSSITFAVVNYGSTQLKVQHCTLLIQSPRSNTHSETD